jgi:FK506-binding protein 4/5
VEHDQAFSDEEKVKSGALKLSLFLNAAAVALKRKDWRKVRTD